MDFKTGDRVKYIGTTRELLGEIGRVDDSDGDISIHNVPVVWDNYGYHGVFPSNLKKVEIVPKELFTL